jgi:single-strand DNA-binding protein
MHQFIGRLGKDPEVRYLESGKIVANVKIGINQLADSQQTDWIKLEVWGESGQAFADTARKGYQVHVAGRVKTDRWTDRNTGEEKMQLCCRVESWKVVGVPQGTAAPAPAPAPAAAPAPAPVPAPAAAPPAAPAPAAWQSGGDIPF